MSENFKKMARAEQKQNVIYSYWWQKRDEKWLLKFIREGKGPSLHYVNIRTGWVGSENGNFCWRSVLYLCWNSRWVGQKSLKICWHNIGMAPKYKRTKMFSKFSAFDGHETIQTNLSSSTGHTIAFCCPHSCSCVWFCIALHSYMSLSRIKKKGGYVHRYTVLAPL